MARQPRSCKFVSLTGATCARPALARRDYCHGHEAMREMMGPLWHIAAELGFWGELGTRTGPARPSVEAQRLVDEIREVFRRATQPAPRRFVRNYYKDLGVERTATHEEIRVAYRKAALRHHPDHGGDGETMKRLNAAYAVLGDKDKRVRYDALLGGR